MIEGLDNDDTFQSFKDNIDKRRVERGADFPEWPDIMLAALRTRPYADAWAEQDVDTSALYRDVLYSLYFTDEWDDSFDSREKEELDEGEYKEAKWQLLTQLKEARAKLYREELNEAVDPSEAQLIAKAKFDSLKDFAEYFFRESDASDVSQPVRDRLIRQLNGFASSLSFEEIAAKAGNVPEVYQAIGHFIKYLETPLSDEDDDEDGVVEVLEEALGLDDDGPNFEGPTPYQLTKALQEELPGFGQYLLYRNGLLADDYYSTSYTMPHSVMILSALSAYASVEEHREKYVRPEHLLLSLIRDDDVKARLKELGIEDIGELYRALLSKIFKEDEEEGDKFRQRVQISSELLGFIESAEEEVFFEKRKAASQWLFLHLLENDEHSKSLIREVTQETISDEKWEELSKLIAKSEGQKAEDAEKKEEPKQLKYNISDEHLEVLLKEYARDLTKQALDGKSDPVIGRDEEIEQVITIMCQRNRGNPLLIGEAGVGKTAIFHGLSQAVAAGNVPEELLKAKVIELDLAAMNSGAMYRGQFEGRLLPIIEGVAERNANGEKIFLCMDELHAAMQAGTASGTPGAGDLLKPHLTSGNLRIIGATTQDEYAQYIQKDHALERRFQTITILPPSQQAAVEILKGLKKGFEDHHKITIPEEVLPLVVRMAERYIAVSSQPDKSISQLDAACARARMTGLSELNSDKVYEAVATAAHIPVDFLKEGEAKKYLQLEKVLPERVLGQDEATRKVASALIAAKADLHDPRKPIGSFLFLGPTGVGKTETAKALATSLHGTEDALIRIDMSDYMEKQNVSRMVGASPSFVGYGEEGQLTGAVRRRPHSVVLFDEVEKAHPDVFRQLLSMLEEGEIVDARGKTVSFRNTIVIMTSNLPESEVKTFFAPEFLNRLDGYVRYNALATEHVTELVTREVTAIDKRLKDRWGLSLQLATEATQYLSENGYSSEYGARHLKRLCATELVQPLGRWLLARQDTDPLPASGMIEVTGLNSHFAARLKSFQSASL